MHAFVFPDAALEQHAGRFVWLSVDTEREENAGFLERYPTEAWPSLYVIDPHSKEIVLRWLGSATVPQLVRLLEDAERALEGGAEGAEALLARADRLYGEGDKEAAAKLYADLLTRAPSGWSRRPRVVESLLFSLWGTKSHLACTKVALEEVPALPPSPSRANAAALGLFCALALPPEEGSRPAAIGALEPQVQDAIDRALGSDDRAGMEADDVSGLFDARVSARADAGDDAGMKVVAERWAAFLEGEAARASSPEARAVFDSHRMSAYLALEQPERAVPMLKAAEAELPADYNPPARLAVIYLELGRLEDALEANTRALAKVYGPRKLRVLQNRADILRASGRDDEARATLTDALRVFDALPRAQQRPRTREHIEGALEALGEAQPTK